MSSRPRPLEITGSIFEELLQAETFQNKVRQHYNHLFRKGGYDPKIHEGRLNDAWEGFCHDKTHAKDSMHPKSKGKPDHFKLSGILVYWLRRSAPVFDFRDLHGYPPEHSIYEELLEKYPSEFAAYDLGLHICSGFEAGSSDSLAMPYLAENDFDYYRDICFLLKRKNLSPHSLGMIYRSLFVPLRSVKPADSDGRHL